MARDAHPLRVVLVGCGGISKTWLQASAEIADLEVVGLVDLVAESAKARRAEFAITAEIGSDLAAMLERLKPDLVFDCTVPEAHRDTALVALAAGCHVLGEKPLANNMEEAAEIVAASTAAGRHHAVLQNRRYLRGIRTLRDFLREGPLGRIVSVNSDFFVGCHFGGFRDEMAHVLLLDMAIHTFDQARFLTDADAENVYCHEWNPAHSWYRHGASAIAIFEMSGGVVYSYRGCWCAEGLRTSWQANWHIVCERGSLRWDGEQGFEIEEVAGDSGFIREVRKVDLPLGNHGGYDAGHASLIADFAQCIREGREPDTICHDNIKSLAMVFGAIESAQNRRLTTL